MTAALSRVDKLPDFNDWITGESKQKKLTPEEIEEKQQEREMFIAELAAFKEQRSQDDGDNSR
jgi:uncharacterized protein YnzC (UPF0291/DUF896 family)